MSVLINWILLILCIYSTSKQEAEEEEEEDWALDLFTSRHNPTSQLWLKTLFKFLGWFSASDNHSYMIYMCAQNMFWL